MVEPGPGPVGSFPGETNGLTLPHVALPSRPLADVAERLLNALPAATFVIDAFGTVLAVTAPAAELVEVDPAALVGRSVLDFVDADAAWVYATTVAMATDYPDVTMGPMRITFVTATGRHQSADLWATNHLDDPEIGGIVCFVTEETSASGIADAVSSVAIGDPIATVAGHVAGAMRGHPVVADAFVVVPDHETYVCITPTALAADLVEVADDEAVGAEPWRAAINSGNRVIHEDLGRLAPVLHEAAERDGYTACWVEPVPGPDGETAAALVLWRRRTGSPSPNQLHSIHQAAAILSVAFRVADVTSAGGRPGE